MGQKIPQQIETQILLNSRRRCCICFGLKRDTRIKQGQIAHLDKNRNNNKVDNLAFLCLSHHDSYDTKTSQSKGLTINEIKTFRVELNKYISDNWNKSVIDTKHVNVDIFTGTYYRGNDFESSELVITYIGGNLIQVKGFAIWGKNREYGPNIGELDFMTILNKNKALFIDKSLEKVYRLDIEFFGDRLLVKEDNVYGYFGMNASFGGEYYKHK